MATKKTTKTAKTTKGSNAAVAVGAGAAALAAAAGAASYYFYGTKNAKKHRQAASAWAKGMKKDVERGVKTLRKIDAKTVARVVDDAAAAYQGVRGVAATDVRMAATELKKNWKMIEKELAPSATVKKVVKKATKAVKAVTPKKAAPKTAKKR